MGILTKEEILDIYDYMSSPARLVAVPFYPVMQKGKDTIVIDKSREQRVMYYLKNNDFNECYKKQTLDEFKEIIEELKKDNWILL